MDDKAALNTLQSLISAAMYTLADLTEVIHANPEMADEYAKGLLLRDAELDENARPPISYAVIGAALYIQRSAAMELELRAAPLEENETPEFPLMFVPREQILN